MTILFAAMAVIVAVLQGCEKTEVTGPAIAPSPSPSPGVDDSDNATTVTTTAASRRLMPALTESGTNLTDSDANLTTTTIKQVGDTTTTSSTEPPTTTTSPLDGRSASSDDGYLSSAPSVFAVILATACRML